MYAAFFGLEREPFSIAPDPRYLFMSERHREALAHLLYGLGGGGGFVLLTGEIGTGKTTLTRLFLEQVPRSCHVAYIFNPKLTVAELLQTVCEEFGIAAASGRDATVKDRVDALNAFLLQAHAAGESSVLVIDEAQNLSPEVLEQLRLLTNLETTERKLLQIVLVGQPELRDMLAGHGLEQLAQRVIARYHLGPLSAPETAQYVQHRLEVAGLQRALPFDRRAVRRIHAHSRGIPRRINLLCDRALLGAYAHTRDRVDAATVDQAAQEVFGRPRRERMPGRVALGLGAVGLAAAAGLYAAVSHVRDGRVAASSVAQRAPAPAARAASGASSPASATAAGPAPAPAASAASFGAPGGAVARGWPVHLQASMDAAWRELATAWQAEPTAGEAACPALARQALQCFQKPMTLPQLQSLGRPGIVTLDDGPGGAGHAILAGLSPREALLEVQGSLHAVPLAAFAARWHGDFATLWRSPAGYEGRTPAALDAWVAQRLAQAHAEPEDDAVPLRTRLRAFQLAHGLPGDGQPGPLTYMQLNRATGVAEPALRVQP
ncbi:MULTISPECIES: AAA family ATPase [Ramlibacter]|uniref:AAA family ATPase n=1 Tax=Ramlibacter aquaticus TaxID=2780094 RepID=A0ABR9SC84_9BURK|nr:MULTISPECIES: AAA family ATPase [Ramlibacter]MBE7939957.1 AAA family ATPase [Ramlibacter aquaticus]